MKKYIIILSLFLCSCTKYRVYNLKDKCIVIIDDEESGYKEGDTIIHRFRISSSYACGTLVYEDKKCLILNKR